MMVVFSCAIIHLVLPRFIANVYAAYPLAMKKNIEMKEEIISSNSLDTLMINAKKSVEWSNNSEYWQLLASLYLYKAQLLIEFDNNKLLLLKQSHEILAKSLFFSPLNPYGWFNLARVDTVLQKNNVQVLSLLHMSIKTGGYEPGLLITRFMMLLENKDSYPRKLESSLLSQFSLIMKNKGEELAKVVSKDIRKYILMHQSVLSSSKNWPKFKQYFEKYFRQNQK